MSQGISQASIDEARDLSIPDARLSNSSKIRRWMLQGDWLDSPSMRRRFNSLFGVVLRDMERAGYTFEKRVIEGTMGNKEYRLTNPEHQPIWNPHQSTVRAAQARKKRSPMISREEALAKLTIEASPVPQPTSQQTLPLNGNGHGVDALPGLGMQVEVFMLALDDDGQVTLGIRSAGQCWMTRVEGYAETASV